MWEQSKAAKRRVTIPAFHNRYFVGHGIDIGGKPDPLGQYSGFFARMQSALTWDIDDGDAQYMTGVSDEAFDFLHASHCLEHMVDVRVALANWIRIVKPGGFLVITVPDEDLYEMGNWPSRFNSDHKWTFTIIKDQSWSPRSINILDLLQEAKGMIVVEKIELLRDFYRDTWRADQIDQTMTPVAECAIEIILQKK
ncbi:MAG: class I SAM-dependent methyltransferase [Proteobacteria bacterium]|nr:class I SAM-dependent methyltransferase [Desulfobulbaceae bacterium]MBU4153813.1 class I SAM-dependent methyltransferase [Pseudomonadota bacterium]MDP2104521.1 methyltransferase domain-containing protein [Desulfobulbaceae bacterium]